MNGSSEKSTKTTSPDSSRHKITLRQVEHKQGNYVNLATQRQGPENPTTSVEAGISSSQGINVKNGQQADRKSST